MVFYIQFMMAKQREESPSTCYIVISQSVLVKSVQRESKITLHQFKNSSFKTSKNMS